MELTKNTSQAKVGYALASTNLPSADSAFGLASLAMEFRPERGHEGLQLVSFPIDADLCRQYEVNPATIRLYQWRKSIKRFRLVEGSRIDTRWRHVHALLDEPGIYVAAGLSSNPWVNAAVTLIRVFRPALHNSQLEPIIRERLCQLILCPGMFGELINDLEAHSQSGVTSIPPQPPEDLCRICVDGSLGHAIDLWPTLVRNQLPSALNDYLENNTRVRDAIIWREPGLLHYDNWSAEQKNDLVTAFERIRAGGEYGLPTTAPATPTFPGDLHVGLSPDVAWEAYIAHLAQCLVVDSQGWVNWSITNYPDEQLALLLASDSMFVFISGSHQTLQTQHGAASHGDPTRIYNWLRDEDLIRDNHTETIGKLLEWCRDNMSHFADGFDPDNMEAHWQYRGYPPVERIISGTTSPYGFRHWTAGCWGTSGFLRLVLRTINIPATLVKYCTHAQPWFPTIDSFLCHGDDPYNQNVKDLGFNGIDLLIDRDTYEEWFDPNDYPNNCENIGKCVDELMAGD